MDGYQVQVGHRGADQHVRVDVAHGQPVDELSHETGNLVGAGGHPNGSRRGSGSRYGAARGQSYDPGGGFLNLDALVGAAALAAASHDHGGDQR